MTESIRFKCLILDHDDTAVDSTASIHYPAHVEIMNPELYLLTADSFDAELDIELVVQMGRGYSPAEERCK